LSLIVSHLFITCWTTRLESPNIFRRVAPHALAIFIPCNKASYSASLLEACGKLILKMYFNLSPWGDIKTTHAPAPWTLLEPLKYIVQTLDKSGGPVLCSSSHSAVKSGKTCDLIAFLFLYVMSMRDNSIPHKETRPVAEGLFNMFDSGASLTTIIGCTAKYYRSLRAVVKTLYANFW
jgi:hypothetical protein